MSKKRMIIIGTLALLTVLGLWWWTVVRNTISLSLGNPVASNVRYPSVQNDTVRFFSGSAFAELKIGDSKSKPLTKFYRLPTVTDIRWGLKGAVFAASNYSSLDELYPKLIARDLDTTQLHWWFVDFEDDSIELLDSTQTAQTYVSSPTWTTSGNEVFYLLSPYTEFQGDGGTSEVTLRVRVNHQDSAVANLEADTLLWANSNKLVYQNRERSTNVTSTYEFDFASKKSAFLTSGVAEAVFTQSGVKVLAIEASNKDVGETEHVSGQSGKLIVAGPAFGGRERVADRFNGTLATSQNNWIAFNEDTFDGFINVNNVDYKKLRIKNIPDGVSILHTIGGDYKTLFLYDEAFRLYAAGRSANLPGSSDSSTLRDGHLVFDSYRISYDKSRQQYDVYVYGDTLKNARLALQYLVSNDLDPYQINLKWFPVNGGPLP